MVQNSWQQRQPSAVHLPLLDDYFRNDLYTLSLQVSALGLDPSGARLVTGGYDYDVRFWDFAGMDQALQAFRSLQPCEW